MAEVVAIVIIIIIITIIIVVTIIIIFNTIIVVIIIMASYSDAMAEVVGIVTKITSSFLEINQVSQP